MFKYSFVGKVIRFGLIVGLAGAINGLAQNKVSNGQRSSLLSTTLVISQAYGGGGGATGTYLNDYVELKNISNAPQSLNGLSLYYGSATGQFASSATNAFALPNITLNPGQYYLVQTSTAGTGGVALPVTPDATTTNLSMSGTNGKVALVNGLPTNSCGATATPCTLPNALIVDLVSWGTANNAEGGASTNGGASLTSVQGNVRKTNGCTETDNNNVDFDIITDPVPRNSASSASACGATAPSQHIVDFDGNGRTDFAVVRNTGGGASGQVTWFWNLNGPGTASGAEWGIASDFFTPGDFDGDDKTDVTVWRPGAGGVAGFYILESSTSTFRFENFGQTGDDPTVIGDYDGDGKFDAAVYRGGAAAGLQSTWFFRGSLNNPGGNITFMPWGQNGDFPAPGDYDGDGKNDFAVQRNNGGGQARFWIQQTTDGFKTLVFGTPTDVITPGDYDGDGKTDVATIRGGAGQIHWFYEPSGTAGETVVQNVFGASATDFPVQGDYDGDGKTDIAIWRPNADPSLNNFWYLGSTSGLGVFEWGANGDYPVANYNSH